MRLTDPRRAPNPRLRLTGPALLVLALILALILAAILTIAAS